MKRITKYAVLAALAGLLVMGCDSGNGGGNEPSSPLTVTNGTVISCDRTTKGSVEIPSDVTAIKDYAFSGCTGLTEISIPSSVRSVGQNAFAGCYGLTVRYAGTKAQWEKLGVDTKNVTVVCRDGTVGGDDTLGGNEGESDVLTIVDGVVVACDRTAKGAVKIPTGVTAIGERAFADCGKITSVSIPRTVTAIGTSAFSGCKMLESVRIPTEIASVEDYTFADCSRLTDVRIPSSVTSIGHFAFSNCGLTSVEIPSSVRSIGNDAFNIECLETIYYGGTMNEWHGTGYDARSDVSVFCSDGTLNLQGNAQYLTIENRVVVACDKAIGGSLKIPAGITGIAPEVFKECTNLKEVTIPSSVTEIGAYAFYQCSNLFSVVIPVGVTSIGYSAFAECRSLTNVVIPFGVTFIEDSVFYRCSKLTDITIPSGVTQIGGRAFSGSRLTSLTIPDSVVSIGDSAFNGCKMTEVTIPSSVVTIGNYAFSSTMLETVTIPSSVTSVGTDAFINCSSLGTIYYGGTEAQWSALGVETYGSSVICTGVPDDMLTIESNVVVRCYQAASGVIAVPDGVTAIGDSAFRDCAGVTSVTIPYGVTSIGSSAFDGCTGLVSVEIPASVTTIGSGAFSGCSSLTVYYNGTRAQWESLRIETYGVPVVCTDDGLGSENQPSVLTIQNRVVVKCDPSATGYIEIQPGVTEIAAGAFSNCVSIKGVVIPEGVTSIGTGAFRYCSDMLSVEVPGSVTYIGDRAFEYCNRLEEVNFTGTVSQLAALGLDTKGIKDMGTVSVTVNYGKPGQDLCHFVDSGDSTLTGYVIIPSGVTEIKGESKYSGGLAYGAFAECRGIKGVGIPSSVTKIGDYAFFACEGLTFIELPNSITEIGSSAFSGCSIKEINYRGTIAEWFLASYSSSASYKTVLFDGKLITEITAADLVGVTKIRNYACAGWSNLRSVTIPNSVTSIGAYAFENCTSLGSVEISKGVTSIGGQAFNGCTSLTSITIPDSVTSISEFVFSECTKLTSVEIPSSVTSISNGAFSRCTSLTSIVISNNVTYIGIEAFATCTNLMSVEIPTSVTTIGSDAFSGCTGLVSVTISNGVTASIGGFKGCIGLTSIKIPNSVTHISYEAFRGCTGLTSINIPSSITGINQYAFKDCSSLATIRYNGMETDWNKIDRWNTSNDGLSGKTITGSDGSTWTAK